MAVGGDRKSVAVLTFAVTEHDTAMALGSGDVRVLGTPRLLAWCEAATCAAVAEEIADGSGGGTGRETSVGTHVQLEHLAASPVGREVTVTATTAQAEGRLRRFAVTARQVDDGRLVARGEITRVIVDAERFHAGAGRSAQP